MKRSIAFVNLADMEQQQLEEFAMLSYQERFDYLKFLQRSLFRLNEPVIDVDDIGKEFIILPRKANGSK